MSYINPMRLLQSSGWSELNDTAKATYLAAIAVADSNGTIKCSKTFIVSISQADNDPSTRWVDLLIERSILSEEGDGSLQVVEWDDFAVKSKAKTNAERQAAYRARKNQTSTQESQ